MLSREGKVVYFLISTFFINICQKYMIKFLLKKGHEDLRPQYYQSYTSCQFILRSSEITSLQRNYILSE